eukprot:COSAG01_NODE_8064_length_2934_cov_3.017989_2_plen_326_part_00
MRAARCGGGSWLLVPCLARRALRRRRAQEPPPPLLAAAACLSAAAQEHVGHMSKRRRNVLSWPEKNRAGQNRRLQAGCAQEIDRWGQFMQGTRNQGELQQVWYMLDGSTPPCKREQHAKRQNCAANPRCVFGLGEAKHGVWAKAPASLSAIEMPGNTRLRDPLQQAGHDLVQSEVRKAHPVGLYNLGATCYVNSILQALFMDPAFRRGIFGCGFDAAPEQQRSTPPPTEPESPPAVGQGPADAAVVVDLSAEESAAAAPASSSPPPSSPQSARRPGLLSGHLQRMFAHLQEGSAAAYNPRAFVEEANLSTCYQQDVSEFHKLLLR